jgi:AmiR/NasT family two-component response regulator
MAKQLLLAIIEMGGYPDFIPLYKEKGYQVEKAHSMRKAQAWLKRNKPDVVVTEFHFDPELRDRMSNLESLFATLQRYAPEARVIVFIEKSHRPRLERVEARHSVAGALDHPVDREALSRILDSFHAAA